MPRRSFQHRSETFGVDTNTPWALEALRLLFHVPRAYQPLVDAWDARYPGAARALDRLAAMGFVAYQAPVVIDTRTAANADRPTRRVARFRTTAKGQRLCVAMAEDIRELEDEFTRMASANVQGVARLLEAFDLNGSHAKYGLSMAHATDLCGLPDRNVRWWVQRFQQAGLIRELGTRIADTREVIPAHWRVTRLLCRQLEDALDSFSNSPKSLKIEFRLRRSRFLADIDPARIGISGATDFDHDVQAQRILAAFLRSPRCVAGGIFTVEPRLALAVDVTCAPWRFDANGDDAVFYQPDAELRERGDDGLRRTVVEYERVQTRRDAWSHIERFLGYLHLTTLPFESAMLRFVVESETRIRSYVDLIEAFADYCIDHAERMPRNQVTLAVSSIARVVDADDPLDTRAWHRITLPARAGSDTPGQPVLHAQQDSPYDDYFSQA